MEKIGVGVVGCGLMGLRHARIYSQLPESRLVAVVDLDEEKAKKASKELGVQGYSDLNRMLEREDISAVSICVSDPYHLEPSLASIAACKHVLIEKPLADNVQDALKILEATRKAKTKFVVGHLLRFEPHYAEGFEVIKSGNIGDIVHICARRNSGPRGPRYYGGESNLPFHMAVHDIDIMHWYVGETIERVYAESNSKVLRELGIDDSTLTVLKFKNGVIASMEHSWILPSTCDPRILDQQMEVMGSKGVIYLSGDSSLKMYSNEGRRVPNTSLYHVLPSGMITGCLRSQLAAFLESILSDSGQCVTAVDAFRAVCVAEAIKQSLATQEIVPMNTISSRYDEALW